MARLADNSPVLFSVLVTIGTLVLIVVVAVSGRAAGTPAALEAIAAAALVFLARLGWRRWLAGGGTAGSWFLVVLPLAYVLLVYPPLFTGGYRLSLQDTRLSALVAANGFAAGVMEEVVFRGLVLG